MEEAADAVKAVFQNNLIPEDAGREQIDAISARVSNLATVLGEDAGKVGAAVSNMLRTGVAKSAEEAFDILNRGASLGINKSEDLLDTFNEYGTQFRKLGVDGPEALGLINQAIKAGARDSDVAADALKEFSIRAIDGSKTTVAGFEALGLSAEDMGARIAKGGDSANSALDLTLDKLRGIQDPVKRSAIAVELFGTQAEDLGDALFAMDPSSAAKGIGDLGNAAEKAGAALEQSAGAKVQAFTRDIQGKLIVALAGAVDWIGKNSELLKTLAIVLGPIAAIIATIVAAIKIWTIVQTALNFVLTANPIGIIVVAIAAFIAIIILAYKNSETFRNIVQLAWQGIQFVVGAVVDWFTTTAWPAIKKIFDLIVVGVKFVVSIWVAEFKLIQAIVAWVRDKVAAIVAAIVRTVQNIATGATFVYNTVKSKFTSLVNFIAGLPGRIAAVTRSMWDGIKNSFRNAINFIIDGWNSLSFTLPSIDTPFGKIGGTTISTPNIGHLASGGWAQPGKTYLTGENGPELLSVGRRAFVHNNGETEAMGGAPTVQVFIGERELTDIVDVQISSSDRQKRRMAGARPVGGFA